MKGHMTIINIYSLSMFKVTTTAICELVTLLTDRTHTWGCALLYVLGLSVREQLGDQWVSMLSPRAIL